MILNLGEIGCQVVKLLDGKKVEDLESSSMALSSEIDDLRCEVKFKFTKRGATLRITDVVVSTGFKKTKKAKK